MILNRRSALFGLATIPILAAATALATPAWADIAPAGAVIGNQAIAVYETPGGLEVSVSSNRVETVVNQVYMVDLEAGWDSIQSGVAGDPDDALLNERQVAQGGGIAVFSHRIENLGNGVDSFNLSALYTPGAAFGSNSIQFFADDDGDGDAELPVPITQTPPLNAGDVFTFVVQVEYLSTLTTPGPVDDPIIVTATSVGNSAVSDAVSDDIAVINDAVVTTNKQILPGSGGPGDTLTVTLTYSNSGNAPGVVRIKDPLPPELVYQDGTATWSDNSDAALDENGSANTASGTGDNVTFWAYGDPGDGNNAGGAIPGTIDLEGAGSNEVLVFEIDDVQPGTSGTVSFNVQIAPGTAAGSYRNSIFYCVEGVGGAPLDCDPRNPGPQPTFDVNPVFDLTMADSQSGATPPANDTYPDVPANLGGTVVSSTDTDGDTTNDVVEDDGTNGNSGGQWAEGSTIPFEFVVTNDGSTTDTFNLTHSATSLVVGDPFPAGTLFEFRSAADLPLLDNSGEGPPDIQLGANESVRVRLLVTLPAGETKAAAPSWVHEVIATSVGDPTLSNQSVAVLSSAVIADTVDIQNAGGLDGAGTVVSSTANAAAGATPDADLNNGGDPFTTLTADPGGTVEFYLPIFNTSAGPKSYELEFTNVLPTGTPVGASNGTFAVGSLPAGFTAQTVFDADGDPSTLGDQAVTSNTGVVAGGGTAFMIVRVTAPGNATPQDVDIWFRVSSSSGAAFDVKLDRLTVNPIVDLSIEPDQSVVGAPGSVSGLPHIISNLGNVGISDGPISYSPDFDSFASDLYVDVNGDGVLDPGDISAGTISTIAELLTLAGQPGGAIDPGETFTIFNRVQLTATGLNGVTEEATIVIGSALTDAASNPVTDGSLVNNQVTDEVTIVTGDLTVVKEQSLDADCNGAPDVAFAVDQVTADPGLCILYRITATNTGAASAIAVEIRDETPTFTTYEAGLATATLNGAPVTGEPSVEPANGATGPVTAVIGDVLPGGVATMTFGVEINTSVPNAGAGATLP